MLIAYLIALLMITIFYLTYHLCTVVLADLPLPSALPTPLEATVLGKKKISDESKKLLESTNPVLCSRITEALLATDISFL